MDRNIKELEVTKLWKSVSRHETGVFNIIIGAIRGSKIDIDGPLDRNNDLYQWNGNCQPELPRSLLS